MINPFLRVRQGWGEPEYLHESLRPALEETVGVVVFHEQVLRIVAETTGVTLAQADEVRRAMGSPTGQEKIGEWWRAAAKARGYTRGERERIWAVLAAFASFGFCKAHAAAFALPTYQSAWLNTHHLAAFVAGVLTHDPGMYPKRLILADARTFGVPVLGVDINASRGEYRVERVSGSAEEGSHNDAGASVGLPGGPSSDESDPSAGASEKLGLRIGFADVKGGTLYQLLKRLEGAGLVDVEWRPGEAGPGRKFYLINTAGSQRLMALTASWQRYSATVARLLDEGSAS